MTQIWLLSSAILAAWILVGGVVWLLAFSTLGLRFEPARRPAHSR